MVEKRAIHLISQKTPQHAGRIPVAHNEIGVAYLMFDYIPGPNGREGQLVFNIDEVDIVVLEPDFASLIETYVLLLEDGKMSVKKQPPDYVEGYWFVSSTGETLDGDTYQRLRSEARASRMRPRGEKEP